MRSILIRMFVLIAVLLAVVYLLTLYPKEPPCLEFVEAQWMPSDRPPLTLQEVREKYGKDAYIASVKVVSFVMTDDVIEERPIILKRVFLTGEEIEEVWVAENEAGVPTVNIKFSSSGAKVLHEVTSKTSVEPIVLLLNNKVISAPTIYEPITNGRLEITHDLIITENIDELAEKFKKLIMR